MVPVLSGSQQPRPYLLLSELMALVLQGKGLMEGRAPRLVLGKVEAIAAVQMDGDVLSLSGSHGYRSDRDHPRIAGREVGSNWLDSLHLCSCERSV